MCSIPSRHVLFDFLLSEVPDYQGWTCEDVREQQKWFVELTLFEGSRRCAGVLMVMIQSVMSKCKACTGEETS